MVRLARSQPNRDTASALRSAVRERRHEQDRTARAHLHVEAPEGAATVDKEDHRAALSPSRQGVRGTRDAQNAATSPSGFGHGEDLASGSGSSRVAGGDQGTRGVHGDPIRESALGDHADPKTDRAPHVAQVRAHTKGASAEMQRRWAGQARLVGDQDGDTGSSSESAGEGGEQAMSTSREHGDGR